MHGTTNIKKWSPCFGSFRIANSSGMGLPKWSLLQVCFMATSVPQACSIAVVNDELENVLDGSGRGLNEVLSENTPATTEEKNRKLVRIAGISVEIWTGYLPNTDCSGLHFAFTHIQSALLFLAGIPYLMTLFYIRSIVSESWAFIK